MAVENLVAEAIDPGTALADFAIRHRRHVRAELAAECAHHVLDGIERNAANQKKTVTHRSHPIVRNAAGHCRKTGNLGLRRRPGEN